MTGDDEVIYQPVFGAAHLDRVLVAAAIFEPFQRGDAVGGPRPTRPGARRQSSSACSIVDPGDVDRGRDVVEMKLDAPELVEVLLAARARSASLYSAIRLFT